MDLWRIKLGLTEDYETVYWKDRSTHGVCYGKSGGGKSALIENGVHYDSFSGHTQIVLDPSGELASDCYSILKGKAHFMSLDTPIALNIMRLPYRPTIISSIGRECINQTISVTTSNANANLTSKMSNIFNEEMLNRIKLNHFSLVNVRDAIANRRGDNETRDGILSRLNFLLADERMNKILCGNETINIGELIRKKESLVISCKHMTPEQYVFLGTLITQLVAAYMMYEATTESNPASLWIDEAQLFIRESFLDVLKRIRKYHVSCFMATQDMASIANKINLVMLNVGTIIAFRVGANDASYLAREMRCAPEDLQFLPKFTFGYLTEDIRGFAKSTRPPFFKKIEPKRPEPKRAAQGGWFKHEPLS